MLNTVVDIFFPPVCPLCELALKDGPLCRGCLVKFSALRLSPPVCTVCTVCGEPFASKAAQEHTCSRCIKKHPPFIMARSAYRYAAEVLDAVHALKYSGNVTLASALGGLMLGSASGMPLPDLVVPVPLHVERLRKRGFNQSVLLAREVGRGLGAPVEYSSLRRIRTTAPQVSLRAEERRKNVAGAFGVARTSAFDDKKVLLIDDVFTTGATVTECSRALKRFGARVYVLTLARASTL